VYTQTGGQRLQGKDRKRHKNAHCACAGGLIFRHVFIDDQRNVDVSFADSTAIRAYSNVIPAKGARD